MDIVKGFQIEQPEIFVPWDIARQELESLLCANELERIPATGAYRLSRCRALCGLDLSLWFSFDRSSCALKNIAPVLNTTQFRVRHSRDKVRSIPLDVQYDEIQAHLEATFGLSTFTSPGEGFINHTWIFPGVRIEHSVHEHFGPNEHVYIEKLDSDKQLAVASRDSRRNIDYMPREMMNSRETEDLKKVLRFMERDGRIESLDVSAPSAVPGTTEIWYRFSGTRAIHRFVQFNSTGGGKWELVLPEHIRGSVQ